MADLMKDVNYLRFYYTSDDAAKDKDWCKNEAFHKYQAKMSTLFTVPILFQFWQISLTNVSDKLAMYKQVRMFKSAAIIGACSLGLWEYSSLRKKLTFYDRFYPEPTELQRKLNQEALIFKEQAYKGETTEEREAKAQDPDKVLKYSQFYMLAPQNHIIMEEQFNADDHQKH